MNDRNQEVMDRYVSRASEHIHIRLGVTNASRF
jgi:hypothetical protein